jgi:hypothetical protein
MRSRAARVTLALLAIAAVAAAGYFYWTTQKRIVAAAAAASRFTDSRLAATRAALELRSAQQAYVAVAQNETFWFDKASECMDALRHTLPVLESSTTSTEARAALTAAAAALQEFSSRDARIRGYVSSGQRLLASDLIFTDGLELVSQILESLDRAGSAAAQDARIARQDVVRQQILAAAGAIAISILVLLLLVPLPTRSDSEVMPKPSEPPAAAKGILDLDLRPTIKTTPQQVQSKPAPPTSASPPRAARPAVELEDLARVCTDLARLSDGATIPTLLERTATTLDASGIVLWMVDGERQQLLPIAAHGYSPNVVARLGTLRVDAENATAAAFRTGLMQTVAGSDKSSGAVAAPLVSPSGCVGVMSAEMRHGGEQIAARRAAASIVAAQLATIVSPPATRADEKTAAL